MKFKTICMVMVMIVVFAGVAGAAFRNAYSIPEPASFVLLGSGIIALATWGRKKARN